MPDITFSQKNALTASEITAAVPTIDTPDLFQGYSLAPIVTGNPVVDTLVVTQAHSLTASAITTGAPSVANATLSNLQTLTLNDITTGAPVVDHLDINPLPFFVNATTNSSTGSTTISINTPTNIADDLIVVAIAWELSNATATPVQSGWNSLWSTSNAARAHTQNVYWRRSNGSEPSSFSFTITSAEWVAAAISIRNASNPYSASAQFNNSQVTATTAPTLTTTHDSDLIVFVGSSMNGTTYTAPTNFTERADVRSAVSASGVSVTIDTYLQPTAGSSGKYVMVS